MPGVQRARDVAVGDRIEVAVQTAPPGLDPYGDPPPWIIAVVVVDKITVMACGCSRAEFSRPGSALGPSPRVHVFSAGCRWTDDHVDFADARARAATADARAAAEAHAAAGPSDDELDEECADPTCMHPRAGHRDADDPGDHLGSCYGDPGGVSHCACTEFTPRQS